MIIYEDAHILVCHKPSGLPVQSAGVGRQDMMSLLMNYLSEKQQGIPYLGLVHRLDQPVEGILVFAKNKKAAAELSRQVTDGSMKKVYRAVCCERGGKAESTKVAPGKAGEQYHLTNYLKKDARTNTSSIVSEKTPGAKKSELIYQVLEEKEAGENRYSLVEIHLLTGRHHQIRVQMAGSQKPLYGDRKYNKEWEAYRLPQWEESGGTQLALCAASLSFWHPANKKKRMEFQVQPSGEIFRMFAS